MSLAWSLRTLTREWFLAWTYRCAKVAYRSRLKLPCSLTNSHQRLETGGTLHNLHSVRDNDGFAGNIIFPSLVARRYSTYGLHRFLLFFFSFSLSYRTFMPHSFHCPLFFFFRFSFDSLLIFPFISLYLWFTSTTLIIVYFAKYYWGRRMRWAEHVAVTEGKGNSFLVGKVRGSRTTWRTRSGDNTRVTLSG